MSTVSELGYVGLSVSDANAWRSYATRILGMEAFDEGEADRFYLRMDLWHHRLVVHSGGNDDIAYVGWRVAGPAEFAALKDKLAAAGHQVRIACDGEARERRVLGLMKLVDPAGVPTEIFFSPRVDAHKPFHPGRPLFGKFRTASEGMGHIMFREPDLDAAIRFYSLLGFSGGIEYLQKTPDGGVLPSVFMHCNDRQHTIAMVPGGPRNLLHMMFTYAEIEDFGQTYDLARQHEIDICATLGMHANDRSMSFYMASPSGFIVEPGWGGCVPDQQQHHVSDVFGHDLEAGQYVGNIPFRPIET
jgi:2,3-dihydroxyethylbenzene 1,2-dioxygenase